MTATASPFLGRPDPPTTPETVAWWDATRERRLTVQRCVDCGEAQLYPREICTHCGGERLELAEASGTGRIYSHTTIEKSPNPALFRTPYVLALVRLAEGPIVLTNLVGAAANAGCDDEVEVVWEPLPDGRHLPLFSTPSESDIH
jgi:uncharacterized OB-fold protein